MMRLLMIWLDICLLRAGPQDLPASILLKWLALLAYALVAFGVSVMTISSSAALVITFIDIALLAGFTGLILYWSGRPERFNQTLAALSGCGALLGLIAWPLIHHITNLQAQGGPQGLSALLWLVLLAWNLVVVAHIVRHALSVSFLTGMGVSVLYFIVSIYMINKIIYQYV